MTSSYISMLLSAFCICERSTDILGVEYVPQRRLVYVKYFTTTKLISGIPRNGWGLSSWPSAADVCGLIRSVRFRFLHCRTSLHLSESGHFGP